MVELSQLPMARNADPSGAKGRRRPGILIADDTGLILTLLKFELVPLGFDVWLAVDGDDAVEIFRRHADEIDVTLLDVQMPGLDGPQTLRALRRLDPAAVVCFMTGRFSAHSDQELLALGAAHVFRKPFRPFEIAEFLQRMCVDLPAKSGS